MLPPKFSFALEFMMGSWGLEVAGKELPSVDFYICLSGTCLFYNSGMTFFQESKYVFVLLTGNNHSIFLNNSLFCFLTLLPLFPFQNSKKKKVYQAL